MFSGRTWLDNFIVRAVCRIFNVRSRENVDCLRRCFDFPCLDDIIERKEQRFMDRLIGLDNYDPALRSTIYITVLSVLSEMCRFLFVYVFMFRIIVLFIMCI